MLETLSDIDEMSRRRPEVLGFFSVSEAGTSPGWSPEDGTHPAAPQTRHCPRREQEVQWAVHCPGGSLETVTIRVSPHGDTLLSREQTNLQRLMSSAEESCRNLAFSLALRSIQNNPR